MISQLFANPGGWSHLWEKLIFDNEIEESVACRPEKHIPSSVLLDWWTWQRQPSLQSCQQVLQVYTNKKGGGEFNYKKYTSEKSQNVVLL